MTILEGIGTVLVIAGAATFVVGAIGLFRLPDALARLMPVALVGSVGVLLVLAGAWCFHPGWWAALKVVAVGVLLPLTSSAGNTALARATYMRGAPVAPVVDHLAEHQQAESAHEDESPGTSRPAP